MNGMKYLILRIPQAYFEDFTGETNMNIRYSKYEMEWTIKDVCSLYYKILILTSREVDVWVGEGECPGNRHRGCH